MAKPRHDQPPSTSSRTTLVVMIAGAAIVAALVVWALTRTVEPTPSVSTAETSTTPASTEVPMSTAAPSDTAATASTASTPAAPPAVQGDRSEVKRIAVEDVRAKLNRGEITVIDVRDDASFAAGHIPGALHMPFASIESMSASLPKDKPIVTYCTWPAEESSAGAALILQSKGFQNVEALYGGFHAWTNQGYPTETGAQ